MGIEFESDNFGARPGSVNNQSSSGSFMVDFLIRNGVAKDARTANVILTIGALLFFAASIYFFIYGF